MEQFNLPSGYVIRKIANLSDYSYCGYSVIGTDISSNDWIIVRIDRDGNIESVEYGYGSWVDKEILTYERELEAILARFFTSDSYYNDDNEMVSTIVKTPYPVYRDCFQGDNNGYLNVTNFEWESKKIKISLDVELSSDSISDYNYIFGFGDGDGIANVNFSLNHSSVRMTAYDDSNVGTFTSRNYSPIIGGNNHFEYEIDASIDDNIVQKIYHNGIIVFNTTRTGTVTFNNPLLRIGNRVTAVDAVDKHKINDFKIINSSDEVINWFPLEDYESGTEPNEVIYRDVIGDATATLTNGDLPVNLGVRSELAISYKQLYGYNKAIQFNGIDDWVDTGLLFNNVTSLDISVVVSKSSVTGGIIGSHRGLSFMIYEQNDGISIEYLTTTTDSKFAIPSVLVDGFNLVRVTWDGAILIVYINGNIVGQTALDGVINYTSNTIVIGKDGGIGDLISHASFSYASISINNSEPKEFFVSNYNYLIDENGIEYLNEGSGDFVGNIYIPAKSDDSNTDVLGLPLTNLSDENRSTLSTYGRNCFKGTTGTEYITLNNTIFGVIDKWAISFNFSDYVPTSDFHIVTRGIYQTNWLGIYGSANAPRITFRNASGALYRSIPITNGGLVTVIADGGNVYYYHNGVHIYTNYNIETTLSIAVLCGYDGDNRGFTGKINDIKAWDLSSHTGSFTPNGIGEPTAWFPLEEYKAGTEPDSVVYQDVIGNNAGTLNNGTLPANLSYRTDNSESYSMKYGFRYGENIFAYSENVQYHSLTGVGLVRELDVDYFGDDLVADRIISTDGIQGTYISPTIISGVTYICSCFAKKDNDNSFIQLALGGSFGSWHVNVNLDTCEIGGNYPLTATCEDVSDEYGSGWKRISVKLLSYGTASYVRTNPCDALDSARNAQQTPGWSSIVCGYQISSELDDNHYIKTTGTDINGIKYILVQQNSELGTNQQLPTNPSINDGKSYNGADIQFILDANDTALIEKDTANIFYEPDGTPKPFSVSDLENSDYVQIRYDENGNMIDFKII